MSFMQEQLEEQFSQMAKALDNELEDSFGHKHQLHPNRPKRGMAANPSFDGLFATTFAFTLGYGSTHGRGYIVNIDLRTLECISSEEKTQIQNFAFTYLTDNISNFFPDRELSVVHDGRLIKIVGNFSLS